MKNPPPIDSSPPHPVPQITLDDQIEELITHKKRWDSIEKELRDLRDGLKIAGRIKQTDKAMMILHLESGHNLLYVIQKNYPEYLYTEEVYEYTAQKKGCLSVILLAIVPMTAVAGWFIFSV